MKVLNRSSVDHLHMVVDREVSRSALVMVIAMPAPHLRPAHYEVLDLRYPHSIAMS